TIDGVLSTFIGIENAISGDGNDRLIGDAIANRLFGMRGEDTINGGHGSDVLNGGTGDDLVFGGTARDVLRGASGADRLYGQSGNEFSDAPAQKQNLMKAVEDLLKRQSINNIIN
ncbi:MAG: hypothetical protein AAF403_05365, partial [Pseudomonadota bacterium]